MISSVFRKLCVVVGISATLGMVRQALAKDPVTLPGRGVGRIFLAMQRDDVIRSLGTPRTTYYPRLTSASGLPRSLQGAYVEDEWVSENGNYQLQIVYRRGRVVQIYTNNPKYATVNISVASSFDDIRRRYPRMTVHGYGTGDEALTFYADSVNRGIAFVFNIPDNEPMPDTNVLADKTPDALIVHEPGTSVLPIYNAFVGKRDESDDEIGRIRTWFRQ